MKPLIAILALIGVAAVIACVGGIVYVATGSYYVGADAAQGPIDTVAEITRERSVESRAAQIQVPDLSNAGMVKAGAETYSHLCKGCHLAPDQSNNPTRKGLKPQPPKFTQFKNIPPAEEFWAAKHGIKMTAMPAWGKTLSDSELWKVIAFLQKLPDLSVQTYKSLAHDGHSNAGGGS